MANQGDRTVIYKDPYLRQQPEGLATLVKKVQEDRFCEVWQVEFRPGTPLVERKISSIDLNS